MIDFEGFADPKRHPFSDLERKMARAYRDTVEELESASRDLWKTMRVDDSMLPYFLPEYEDPARAVQDAEDRLAEIQTDIEHFVEIVGGYSRQDIEEKLHKCEMDIAGAKCSAYRALNRAIQENPGLSPDNVEKLGVVQVAFLERDRIITELTPQVVKMEKKLADAEEILKKYA